MELLELLGGVEGLSDEHKKAVVDALTPEVDKLEKQRNDGSQHSDRLKREKQEADERATTAEAELKTLKEQGMSGSEKLQSQIDDLTAQLTANQTALEAERVAGKASTRNTAIAKVHEGIKWDRKAIKGESSHILIREALRDVEDLSNEAEVKARMEAFAADHPALILAETGGGAGTQSTGAGGSGDVQAGADVQVDLSDSALQTVMHGTMEDAQKIVDGQMGAKLAEDQKLAATP